MWLFQRPHVPTCTIRSYRTHTSPTPCCWCCGCAGPTRAHRFQSSAESRWILGKGPPRRKRQISEGAAVVVPRRQHFGVGGALLSNQHKQPCVTPKLPSPCPSFYSVLVQTHTSFVPPQSPLLCHSRQPWRCIAVISSAGGGIPAAAETAQRPRLPCTAAQPGHHRAQRVSRMGRRRRRYVDFMLRWPWSTQSNSTGPQ